MKSEIIEPIKECIFYLNIYYLLIILSRYLLPTNTFVINEKQFYNTIKKTNKYL